jgi:hypothetical protein
VSRRLVEALGCVAIRKLTSVNLASVCWKHGLAHGHNGRNQRHLSSKIAVSRAALLGLTTIILKAININYELHKA